METERLRITLDKEDKTYLAGETIKGEIWMNLMKRIKIRAIKIQISGKGKCKWVEILRKNANNELTKSFFYTSREIYAHDEQRLPVFMPRGLELSPGEHTFVFTAELGAYLPSSFKGSFGTIKYKLRVVIQRAWTLDERHTIPFTVVKNMCLPMGCRLNPSPLEKQITKTISLFGTRPISVLAQLPEDCAVRGQPVRICVTVSNNSTTNVEKLRFTLLQNVLYKSHVPLFVVKPECIAIACKETGSVHKKSERSFAHELFVPETAQPTDEDRSMVIKISYVLRVEAVLRGFFKNIVLDLPFKLYSHEIERLNGSDMPPTYQDAGVTDDSSGNPFEQLGALPSYPVILNTSIGSPSRSSQYSESSSLYSTADSDSSAATLSPAMAGNSFSYTSGTSSQFNSPSARSSLHNTNVPYLPYAGSPLMINSYPPPHIPLVESPQYVLLPPTPPPPAGNPNTSTAPFRFGQQPAGALELPPSYEELFGTATAPPDISE